MRTSADTLKKVSLELGGKSPNIIFADADIDAAVKGAFNGIFYGKGEVCNAGSRLFVEKASTTECMEKLLERARKLTPGDPLDPKTRLGALVSKAQMERVLEYVRIGKDEGAIADSGRRTRRRVRLLRQANHFRFRGHFHANRAGGNFRPGADRAHV